MSSCIFHFSSDLSGRSAAEDSIVDVVTDAVNDARKRLGKWMRIAEYREWDDYEVCTICEHENIKKKLCEKVRFRWNHWKRRLVGSLYPSLDPLSKKFSEETEENMSLEMM